jgi:DNA-directed RNA polymerase subunit K/omega
MSSYKRSSYFDNDNPEDEDFKEDSSSDSSDDDDEKIKPPEDNEDDDNEIIEHDDDDDDDDVDDDDDDDDVDDVDDDVEQHGGDGDGDDGDDEDDIENGDESKKRNKKIPTKTVYKKLDMGDDDDDDDDDDGEMYLQKFDKSVNNNYILNNHPESITQNYDEILSMTKVLRDDNGIIIDDLHKTIPYLTKYEKARILGQRAKQINSGAPPFVKVPENVIDGYIIAELELKEKRIPFIIRRPLPNGGSEYWSLKDLEDISF